MEDQITQKNREIERQESEIAELKRKHQEEIDRLKDEISQLHDKHQNDLDDEKEQYNKVTHLFLHIILKIKKKKK